MREEQPDGRKPTAWLTLATVVGFAFVPTAPVSQQLPVQPARPAPAAVMLATGRPLSVGTHLRTGGLAAALPSQTPETCLHLDPNADGIPDLAVGAPGEDVGSVADAGRVTILYGSADGTFGTTGGIEIYQAVVGETPEMSDRFGATLAQDDVDGDSCLDLVIATPGEDAAAGLVTVVWGSTSEPFGSVVTSLRQGSAGVAGTAEADDHFGHALAVTRGALWVGAPREDAGRRRDIGVVTFIPGSDDGGPSVQYQQGRMQAVGVAEAGDQFGAALSGGDGLIIGAPGEDIGGIRDAGNITYGLVRAVSQDSSGVPGSAEAGDRFGAAVASGISSCYDVGNDFREPVFFSVVGAPGEDVKAAKDAGAAVLMGAAGSPAGDPFATMITQSSPGVPGTPESGDQLGATIDASGPYVAVGAPLEDIDTARDAGTVLRMDVSAQVTCTARQRVDIVGATTPGQGTVAGIAEAGDRFGSSLRLVTAPPGGDELVLTVGAPGQLVGTRPRAGSITTTSPRGSREVHQDTVDVPGTAEAGDGFAVLAAGGGSAEGWWP